MNNHKKTNPAGMAKTSGKIRSGAYPLLSLPEAIGLAGKLFDNLGAGPHSRQNAAKGIGYLSFSGAASGKIGSMVHFGLLLRNAGEYMISSLAREAFSYPGESGVAAIAEAARHPVLYSRIIDRFSGQPLPKGLPEILVADYKITQKAAMLAARNFIKTIEFAGLGKDGTIFPQDYNRENNFPPDDAVKTEHPNSPAREAALPGAAITITLESGVEIKFPESLAYRISMGEFKDEIKKLEQKTSPGGEFFDESAGAGMDS